MSESRFHGRLFENLGVLLNKIWYLNYVETMFENLEADKYYESQSCPRLLNGRRKKTSAQINTHNMVSSRLWSKFNEITIIVEYDE